MIIQKEKNRTPLVLRIILSIAIYVAGLQPFPAQALCQEPTGGGAVFYKFDRIVLFFHDFPHPDDEKSSTYPSDLKFENFSAALVNEIEKNFAPCLEQTTFWGRKKRKSIIVTREFTAETFDPNSLTIILHLKYFPPDSQSMGNEWNYGVLQFTFFRAGLSPKDAIRPLMYYSAALPIFPFSNTIDLRARIKSFFKMIKPEDFNTEYLKNHPEYRGSK